MNIEYPNYRCVGVSGHGQEVGRYSEISATNHDGQTDYIVPNKGVSAVDAAACWFRLTYKVPGAFYASKSERYKLMTRDEERFHVEKLSDSDYTKDPQTGDLFAAPQGDPLGGYVVCHS